MAPSLRHSLYFLSLLTLSLHPLSAQEDVGEGGLPQIRLAEPLPSPADWFHHVPPSSADFRGIVLTEAPTVTYHPVLPYVFFDSASTQIPDRYVLFDAPVARPPAPAPECVDDLACHYQVLNIIGERLRENPELAITIVGYNAESQGGEDSSHSRGRAESVRGYLHEVWGIEGDRMAIRTEPGSPMQYRMSAPFVTWRADARRVEIEGRFGTVEWKGRSSYAAYRDSLNQILFGPTTDSAVERIVLPTVLGLELDGGADRVSVVHQQIDVRFNDIPVDQFVDMYPDIRSLPYALMRAVPTVLTEGSGVLGLTLVVRYSGGEVRRSPQLQIPVLVISKDEAADRYATERQVVRGRIITELWREDPNPFGSVARGTVQLFQREKAGKPYRLSVLSSVDSVGRSDRRHRLSQIASWEYARALRPVEGDTQLESRTAGLASGGLLGFALPEERVIGESTYIVLDFPRCVDSVDAEECRFRRRRGE